MLIFSYLKTHDFMHKFISIFSEKREPNFKHKKPLKSSKNYSNLLLLLLFLLLLLLLLLLFALTFH